MPLWGTRLSSDEKGPKRVRLAHFRDSSDTWLNFLSGTANVLAACQIPLFMYLFGRFADQFGPQPGPWGKFLAYMALTAVAMLLLSWLGCTSIELSAERQMRRLKANFLEEIMKQEIGYFDQFDALTLASQLTFHCISIREAIGHRLGIFVLYIALSLSCVGYGLYENWNMTLFSLITFPFIVVAGFWATWVDLKVSKEGLRAFEDAASTAHETLGAIRTVKAFSLERTLVDRFATAIKHAFMVGVQGGQKVGLAVGMHWFLMFVSFTVGFVWGIRLVSNGMKEDYRSCTPQYNDPDWTMGKNCFSGGYAIGVFNCMVFASFFLSKIAPFFTVREKARAAITEVVQLYTRKSKINPYSEEGTESEVTGRIEFKNVKFSYPTAQQRCVFNDLNLTIPAGKTVALVGASGCGKSTIVQLLERFYDVDQGEILIDGVPITDYKVNWLRNQTALVSQEPRLFSESINDNIAHGCPGATRDDVIAAAKDANAHAFIMQFPDGYDTHVGEGGGQLSGGQKQRIAIARAILRNPKILILDEATSALDNESEKIVQETLHRIVAQGSRTTIIIAHRLSTVRDADIIVVLDNPEGNGAVVAEQGTHDELKSISDGLYAALVSAQMGQEDGHQDEYRRSLQTSADLASMYSADLPARQQSIIKLTSKFSTVREHQENAYGRGSSQEFFRASSQKGQRLYRRTISPLKNHKLRLGLGCLGGVLNGAVWPVFGVAYSYLIGAFIQTSSEQMWRQTRQWWYAFPLIGLVAFFGLFLQTTMMEFCGQVVVRNIRNKTFSSMLKQDVAFFDDAYNSPGLLMGLLSGDALSLRGWSGDNFAIYCQCITAILMATILSMYASWKLGLIALASVLIVAPIAYMQSRLQRSVGKGSAVSPHTIISEVVLNIRTVTAFNLQTTMSKRFEELVTEEYVRGKPKAYWVGFLWGLSQSVLMLIVVANMWYGVVLVIEEDLDVGDMMQAVLCLMFAAVNVGKAFTSATTSAKAREAAERIFEVIDNRPIIDDQSTSGRSLSTIDHVEFDKVSFVYPQRPEITVYQEVNFTLPKGKVTALVGASGCGKSTAVQLLERFYDVYASPANALGRVTVNKEDIRDFNVQSLRKNIGLVSQEPVLFWGTVEENIYNGNFEASANDIIEASKKANAHEFISGLEDGYQTNVGRGGSKLSGGQKQRIAIARALIRKPRLLILDEATSALDAESERIVQAALDQLLATHDRTTLVIAHRLSTIRKADQIVVFLNPDGHGSRIAEVGTHEELMRIKGGVYRGLVRIAEQR